MKEFSRMLPATDERSPNIFASVRALSDKRAMIYLGSIGDKGSIREVVTPSEAKLLYVVLAEYLAFAEGAGVEFDPNAPVGVCSPSPVDSKATDDGGTSR